MWKQVELCAGQAYKLSRSDRKGDEAIMTVLKHASSCAAFIICLLLLFTSGAPFGSAAPQSESFPSLAAMLDHEDWEVRRRAAASLGESEEKPKRVAQALTKAAKDQDSRVRQASAESLGKIAGRAREAARALTGLLSDDDPSVRQTAAAALGKLGKHAGISTFVLTSALEDQNWRVRAAAAGSLGADGLRSSVRVSTFSQLLDDTSPEVRTAAVGSLGNMGKDAAPDLIRALGDDEPAVRRAAEAALGGIGKPAVPIMIRSLGRDNPVILQSLVNALARMGNTAIPALTEAIEDEYEDSLTRQYAALTLGRIGLAPKGVMRALLYALEDQNPRVRGAAVRALGAIGPPAADATSNLIEILRRWSEEAFVREYAARRWQASRRVDKMP